MAFGDQYLLLFFFIIVISLLFLLLLSVIVRPRPVRIPIKNRHVFISGSSSGIGLALAHRAASDGARVSILARNPSKLDDAKDAIRLATGVHVSVFSADVRDFAALKEAINAAGHIDVLVCNHGVFSGQEIEKQDLEEIRLMIDVNLMGTIHLIKAALPSMKRDRDARGPASIAIMSSRGGLVGIYGYAAYSASKFGLRGLAEALQQEVNLHDIHVSLIFPSHTDTPGLMEANKKRLELTNIIAPSPGAMKADEVARIALCGIKHGRFIIPCNFEGKLLSLLTAGLSPQRSYFMAFFEVVAAGVLRVAALFFQWKWYGTIEKWYAQK